MIDELIDGISLRLNKGFGAEKRIYSEKVEQGLLKPGFFIKLVGVSQVPRLKGRCLRKHAFDISYYPLVNASFGEMEAVAEALFAVLETITLANGDKIGGSSMSYQISDGILHFLVNYDLHLQKVDTTEAMEGLEVKAGLE